MRRVESRFFFSVPAAWGGERGEGRGGDALPDFLLLDFVFMLNTISKPQAGLPTLSVKIQ